MKQLLIKHADRAPAYWQLQATIQWQQINENQTELIQ